MNLTDLKRKPVPELLDMARDMGLENMARQRKPDDRCGNADLEAQDETVDERLVGRDRREPLQRVAFGRKGRNLLTEERKPRDEHERHGFLTFMDKSYHQWVLYSSRLFGQL